MVRGTDSHSDLVEDLSFAHSTLLLDSSHGVWEPRVDAPLWARHGGGGTYEDWYHQEDSTRC